jgi:hypothetical protein
MEAIMSDETPFIVQAKAALNAVPTRAKLRDVLAAPTSFAESRAVIDWFEMAHGRAADRNS